MRSYNMFCQMYINIYIWEYRKKPVITNYYYYYYYCVLGKIILYYYYTLVVFASQCVKHVADIVRMLSNNENIVYTNRLYIRKRPSMFTIIIIYSRVKHARIVFMELQVNDNTDNIIMSSKKKKNRRCPFTCGMMCSYDKTVVARRPMQFTSHTYLRKYYNILYIM